VGWSAGRARGSSHLAPPANVVRCLFSDLLLNEREVILVVEGVVAIDVCCGAARDGR
jgi:hypothetical protein